MKEFYEELIGEIISNKLSLEESLKLRRVLARKYRPKVFPSIVNILMHATEEQLPKLRQLVTKPTRVISGVHVVAIMTKPLDCPHGKCIQCPGGLDSSFGDVPQSYTGNEPATMRAMRNNFDPYLQVFNRLEQYIIMDTIPDKVELIIMGGTFLSATKAYKESYVKYAFKAMNDFSRLFFRKGQFKFNKFKDFFELPGNINDDKRSKSVRKKILKLKGKCDLGKEQKKNEKVKVRCVGLTVESRPDYAMLKHGNEMLSLGTTRVELGVQSVFDDVLDNINRGHSVKDSVDSFRIMKDLGLKINAHMMLGLPGSSPKRDLESLQALFVDPDFRPDMLKIYPCMVMPGTKLEKLYNKGKYKPLSTLQAVDIISDFKKDVPEYVRIMRVQRDIPTKVTVAGVDKTNLRQYVQKALEDKNISCKCIRCREAGRAKKIGKISIKVLEYDASQGKEFFISAEDKAGIVIGFCRLRFPSESFRKEITNDSAIIRELHVYSPSVEIGKKGSKGQMQHKGFGLKLLKTAERIAKKNGKGKILVISGIGVREYYKKFGYRQDGPYVSKRF